MVFDRVVEQGRACQVRVADPVVADDPDRPPQQVLDVGLALALVAGVQPGSQAQCLLRPVPVGGREVRDLGRQSLPQPGLAMH
jgi:hypothetical protein